MPSVPSGSPSPPRRPARSCWALAEEAASASQQLLEPVADRGAGQHRVGGQLAGAHPEQGLFLGQAPVGGELGHVGCDQQQLVRRGPRNGQGVLAQGPLGQMADHRADLQAEEHRPDGGGPLAEQAAEVAEGFVAAESGGAARSSAGWPAPAGGPATGVMAVSTVPPRFEGPQCPVAPAHRNAGQSAPVGRHRHAGGLHHVELRHPGQLLELDPLEGLDVVLRRAAGGHVEGERPGHLPLVGGVGPQHVHEVTEQGLEGIPRVSWFRRRHPFMLRRGVVPCVGGGRVHPTRPRWSGWRRHARR